MRSQLILVVSISLAVVACSEGPKVACGAGTHAEGMVCVRDPVTAPDVPDGGEQDGGSTETPDGGAPDCSPACGLGFGCVEGSCVKSDVPGDWRCAPATYGDGKACDCDCGVVDPDCASASLPVTNCLSKKCEANGKCAACVPDCAGRSCGDDGCGGACGYCLTYENPLCIKGKCEPCVPSCTGRTCGGDGCGGDCGVCPAGKLCAAGQCAQPPAEASCLLSCGGVARSGCSCEAGCATNNSCCIDIAVCGCQPDCAQRECGDDGCGGLCGRCARGDRCEGGLCVDDKCLPDPCHAHGTCATDTGSCTCAATFEGAGCDRCATGFVFYPDCVRDICDLNRVTCTSGMSCDPLTGDCQ